MKKVVAFIVFLVWLLMGQPTAAQCTAPGCELATAVVSEARATGRAVLTAEAPPTWTPAPTATPLPTSTPLPTWTPQPTATERPSATPEPTQISAPTATNWSPASTPAPARAQRSTVGDDLLVVFGGVLILIALGLATARYFKPREWIERIDREKREKGRWDR